MLIVDDSALVRDILKSGLSRFPEIEVVGAAPDVYVARDKIVRLEPDVLTLDIEMPRMDGIDFLKRLMPQYPIPVVVVSALAAPGARATLDALENGAVDYVLKPSIRIQNQLSEMLAELKNKILVASKVDVSKWKKESAPRQQKPVKTVLTGTTDKVIAIGASTGGTVALRTMIERFPADMPGTVIVQHMPPVFTKLFAERLNELSAVEVREAEDGDRILKGTVLIAPGGKHLEVLRSGGTYRVQCREGKKVNGHCPSVSVLFASVARSVGSNAVGVILTGMGRDGAEEMCLLKEAGAKTLAQNEQTSVVYGMPKAAFESGGVERLIGIDDMTGSVIDALKDIV